MTDDATGSALTGMFGGQQQVNQMAEDAKKLLGDAKAGKWAVDEDTGTHLRRAITQMRERVAGISRRIYRLQQAPKLGKDAYAKKVAQQFHDAMNADDQALVPVFNKARESLDILGEAIDEAVKHYNASDEAATMRLGPFKN